MSVRKYHKVFKILVRATILFCLLVSNATSDSFNNRGENSPLDGAAKNCTPVELLCGDSTWKLYKDEKCVKLIDEFMSFDEARSRCEREIGPDLKQLDLMNPILTIENEDEQIFFQKFIFEESRVVNDVWLGGRKNKETGQFSWNSKLPMVYTNWQANHPEPAHPHGDSFDCLEMTSQLSSRSRSRSGSSGHPDLDKGHGRWKDTSCSKRNLIVCQRIQAWSPAKLQQSFTISRSQFQSLQVQVETLENNFAELQADNEILSENVTTLESKTQVLKQNPVPVGFLYTQFPGQVQPGNIWPNVVWTEVTSEYAGLFFRAEGGSSLPFNPNSVNVQKDSTRQLTQMEAETSGQSYPDSLEIPPTGWSKFGKVGWYYPSSGSATQEGIKFHTSDNEVRPRNTAVRIWKRTA